VTGSRLPVVPSGDQALVAAVDAACADAVRLAAGRLACRVGCTECCVGPFPISALDAARLSAGLDALAAAEPALAAQVAMRARRAVARMAPAFPGDPDRGALAEDEAARDAFLAAHGSLPCPALDPESGRCELYAHRPLSCRTFGPPMEIESQSLPPCRLCFVGASDAEVEAARGRLDCHALEEPLEREVERAGASRETLVAYALLR
jgi:Fe-S-cluster containining protein